MPGGFLYLSINYHKAGTHLAQKLCTSAVFMLLKNFCSSSKLHMKMNSFDINSKVAVNLTCIAIKNKNLFLQTLFISFSIGKKQFKKHASFMHTRWGNKG